MVSFTELFRRKSVFRKSKMPEALEEKPRSVMTFPPPAYLKPLSSGQELLARAERPPFAMTLSPRDFKCRSLGNIEEMLKAVENKSSSVEKALRTRRHSAGFWMTPGGPQKGRSDQRSLNMEPVEEGVTEAECVEPSNIAKAPSLTEQEKIPQSLADVDEHSVAVAEIPTSLCIDNETTGSANPFPPLNLQSKPPKDEVDRAMARILRRTMLRSDVFTEAGNLTHFSRTLLQRSRSESGVDAFSAALSKPSLHDPLHYEYMWNHCRKLAANHGFDSIFIDEIKPQQQLGQATPLNNEICPRGFSRKTIIITTEEYSKCSTAMMVRVLRHSGWFIYVESGPGDQVTEGMLLTCVANEGPVKESYAGLIFGAIRQRAGTSEERAMEEQIDKELLYLDAMSTIATLVDYGVGGAYTPRDCN